MPDSGGIPSDRIRNLNEAFSSFTAASGLLERYYGELGERVRYLTEELEERNAQLKAALADAESAKDNLRCVLQSMGEALVVLDPDGNVAMVNRAAAEMLGPQAADAAGRPFEELGCALKIEGDDTVLVANGKRYDVIVSRSGIVDPSGSLRGTVLLIQDITRMKELETQSERNRRLIRMGEMAAKIVHEIRSPLCSIELYATMLESELGEGETSRLSRGISSGILSLNNILTNMLLFSRQQKPSRSRIDAAAVIDEALRMLEPMVGSRGILLERSVSGRPSLEGDPELLKQVLLNVVLNAVQATSGEGRIGVSARNADGAAIIEVSDAGEGIREEDLERIFDPFFSTKVKGTGLGLAIASRIMEAHGGFIRVRSERGLGSVFELHFPPAGAPEEPAA
ncbi:MAG: PAS domain S-box protein [Deltaproteobacteria bacterium]|nr:PAS domain S-box protein [Deltaproteobacteria bacterium]